VKHTRHLLVLVACLGLTACDGGSTSGPDAGGTSTTAGSPITSSPPAQTSSSATSAPVTVTTTAHPSAQSAAGATPPVEHGPASAADGHPAAGQGGRCVLGRTEAVPNSDVVSREYEGAPTKGDLSCARMTELWTGYQTHPKDQITNGMAMIVDFGDHHCSTPTGYADRDRGLYGSCTAKDDSWAFEALVR